MRMEELKEQKEEWAEAPRLQKRRRDHPESSADASNQLIAYEPVSGSFLNLEHSNLTDSKFDSSHRASSVELHGGAPPPIMQAAPQPPLGKICQ